LVGASTILYWIWEWKLDAQWSTKAGHLEGKEGEDTYEGRGKEYSKEGLGGVLEQKVN
jgi:hypothetical protein